MFAPWRSHNPVRKTKISDYRKIISYNPAYTKTCRNLGVLTICMKTRKFRREFKWNGSSRWKFSRKTSNTFRGITFFPFLPKRPKSSVPFVWITSVRLLVKRKRKIYRVFCKLYNSIPFLFSVPKKIPLLFDGNVSTKFPYKW